MEALQMEKVGVKTRDIKFFSSKNDAVVLVHNKTARDYADWLEHQAWVESYETGYPLDKAQMVHVNPVEIRPQFFEIDWASDFLIHFADGRLAVREVTTLEQLQKKAIVTKLELSRRYWKSMGVDDWKLVFPPEEGGAGV
jgi:hypothetical protein